MKPFEAVMESPTPCPTTKPQWTNPASWWRHRRRLLEWGARHTSSSWTFLLINNTIIVSYVSGASVAMHWPSVKSNLCCRREINTITWRMAKWLAQRVRVGLSFLMFPVFDSKHHWGTVKLYPKLLIIRIRNLESGFIRTSVKVSKILQYQNLLQSNLKQLSIW